MLTGKKPSAEVTICNRKGLHARASAKFVKCAEDLRRHGARDARRPDRGRHVDHGADDARRGPGAVITLEAEGPEGPEAIDALVALVESGFGEES